MQTFMKVAARAVVLTVAMAAALAAGGVFAQDADPAFTVGQVASGAKLYANNCAVCHGSKMVESSGGVFDLRTFPPAQRARFINSVTNGKNSMPPWRSLLSPQDIGDLWAYVVAGEPR